MIATALAGTAQIATSVPFAFVIYFRLTILVSAVAALILMSFFTWAYRRFIRGYGLLILGGIICYQLSEIYRSAWALTQIDLPLSWAGLFSLAGNLIFCVICLEPARRKRVRLSESNERTASLLGD
jgi:Mn2+/Fe2+ NRAMP family transporter